MANGTLEDAVQKMIDNAEKAVQVAAVLTSQQIKKDFEKAARDTVDNYYKYTKPPFMDEFNASEPDKLNGNFSKDSTAPTGLGSKLKNQEKYIQQRYSADPKPDFLEDLTIKFRRGR